MLTVHKFFLNKRNVSVESSQNDIFTPADSFVWLRIIIIDINASDPQKL